MANWTLPGLTDLYTNFLTYLKARDDDAARLNDSRVTSATNVPEYAKRWNATTQTFQNWLSSAWSSLVLSVAGGGTGASTAAGARTNLDVYSKAEADAAFVTTLTTAENVLAGTVTLALVSTYYDGPSVSLVAGTWLVDAHVSVRSPSTTSAVNVDAKLYTGSTVYVQVIGGSRSSASAGYDTFPLHMTALITIGSTTTIAAAALCNPAGGLIWASTRSYIRAVKIA